MNAVNENIAIEVRTKNCDMQKGGKMNTLRLVFPQWQGGNMEEYVLGSRLLGWIAPKDTGAIEKEVPIVEPDGEKLVVEDGVFARNAIKKQFLSARKIIEDVAPDKIITFGGDCHVSQAPFSYLNEKYGGEVGLLWIDTHPDISNLKMFNQENAMVMGNLLGEGDNDFSKYVVAPFKPEKVMYGGLIADTMTEEEQKLVAGKGIAICPPRELDISSEKVIDWITGNNIKNIVIHFDLDVLDPKMFRNQLTAKPGGSPIETPEGTLTLQTVQRTITDVEKAANVVGLTISEHIPWDVINLQYFMKGLEIFR